MDNDPDITDEKLGELNEEWEKEDVDHFVFNCDCFKMERKEI